MRFAHVCHSLSLALGLLAAGCSSSPATSSEGDASAEADGAAPQEAASPDAGAGLRGTRYCEVLVGTLKDGNVHVAVYTTAGLSDCPEAEWAKLDEATLKAETMASFAVPPGSRSASSMR